MSKNIELNIATSETTYEPLYLTSYSNIIQATSDIIAELSLNSNANINDALKKLKDLNNSTQLDTDSKAQYILSSYKGNGQGGKDYPNSITFPFIPKLIIMFEYALPIQVISSRDPQIVHTSLLDETYRTDTLFGQVDSGNGMFSKKSADSKTIYWYQQSNGISDNAHAQMNTNNRNYYYFAIG